MKSVVSQYIVDARVVQCARRRLFGAAARFGDIDTRLDNTEKKMDFLTLGV